MLGVTRLGSFAPKPEDVRMFQLVDELVKLLFEERKMSEKESEKELEATWARTYVSNEALREIMSRPLEAPARVLSDRSMLEWLRKQRRVPLKCFGPVGNPERVTLGRVGFALAEHEPGLAYVGPADVSAYTYQMAEA
jgi:hypothetical protein